MRFCRIALPSFACFLPCLWTRLCCMLLFSQQNGVAGFIVSAQTPSRRLVASSSSTVPTERTQIRFFNETHGLTNFEDSLNQFKTAVAEEPSKKQRSRIILGTAALGKAENPFELMDAAYSKGFRRFDLARTYGGGVSEILFGEWMKGRGIDRSKVDIITKGGMGQDKYGNPDRPLLTWEGLQEEVDASLDALCTDSVDMYMFHRDDPRIDVALFVLWANELVQSGKCKQWGVSNWSLERFRQAYEFAMEHGFEPPRANSPQYSLAVPKCEVWPTTHSISGPQYEDHIDWYKKNNVELLCWEVLAKGFMANPHLWTKETVDPSSWDAPVELGSDEWRLQRIQKAYCNDINYHRRRLSARLARKLGFTLSQIAILYILNQGSNISVMFGSNNLDHLTDMVELADYELDEETRFRLDSLTML